MAEGKNLVGGIVSTAVKIITNPWGFYREMPKTGGYQEPIIFLIAMMVVAMVVRFIGVIAHIGPSPMGAMSGTIGALVGIIIGPIIGVVFSFIIAAIIFIIWKIMGSKENYETAYRCAVYSSGIVPITSIIGFIPYIGSAVGLLWGFYLLIVASITVHQIKSSVAWTVWGIIAGLLLILSLSAQFAAKKFSNEMAIKTKEMEKAAKEMEETAKKMQEELKEQMEKERKK